MLVLLFGCSAAPDPAWVGSFDTADGYVARGPVSADPGCEPMDRDGRLDFEAGCVDGACVGMSAAEVEAALGPARWSAGGDRVLGYWGASSAVRAYLADADLDGAPDADAVVEEWMLYYPYDGATDDGLGIGSTVDCYLLRWGHPDAVRGKVSMYGTPYLYTWQWRDPDVAVSDFTDPGWVNLDAPDGYPDIISFSAAKD